MKIFVCCNGNGAIQALEQGDRFYSYDIFSLNPAELEHQVLMADPADGVEGKLALMRDNDCGILICGRVRADAEDMLDRLHISPLAGCIGPADDAVQAFLRGEKPFGFGCGGDCGACGGDCESNEAIL